MLSDLIYQLNLRNDQFYYYAYFKEDELNSKFCAGENQDFDLQDSLQFCLCDTDKSFHIQSSTQVEVQRGFLSI